MTEHYENADYFYETLCRGPVLEGQNTISQGAELTTMLQCKVCVELEQKTPVMWLSWLPT